jgi:hypothetical protein
MRSTVMVVTRPGALVSAPVGAGSLVSAPVGAGSLVSTPVGAGALVSTPVGAGALTGTRALATWAAMSGATPARTVVRPDCTTETPADVGGARGATGLLAFDGY